MTQPLLQAADLRGAARLSHEVVAGLSDLVDVVHTLLPEPGGVDAPAVPAARPTDRGDAGRVEAVLDALWAGLAACERHDGVRAHGQAILAALNGVIGDHLAAIDHPLAIAMQFRHAGRPLLPERDALRTRLVTLAPKVLVLVHDLGMNDLQWHHQEHDHGRALAQAHGYTPVYLHYNGGLSMSTHGRVLAELMERLYDAWPVPITRLAMIGHGAGGLVVRSAIHHGALLRRGGLRWPGRVKDLVCLGTPHQGAPLQRQSSPIEMLLDAQPYASPLMRMTRHRSAGQLDMQLGNVLRAPWVDDANTRAERVPLPDATRCHAVAGSLGAVVAGARTRLGDDGLVPVASALGRHEDASRRLAFAPERQAVVQETGHLDLLSSAEVSGLLQQWLA